MNLLPITSIAYIASINTDAANAPANHVRDAVSAISKISRVELWRARNKIFVETTQNNSHKESSFYFPKYRGGWRLFETLITHKLNRSGAKFDLLYFRFSPSARITNVLKKLESFKVLELNGLEVINHPKFIGMAKAMDLILVPTKLSKENLLAVYPDLQAKINIHSNVGIDALAFHPTDQSQAKHELSLSPDKKYVLHASGFQKHHDFPTLFGAFSIFAEKNSNIELIMAGHGPRIKEVMDLAKQYQLGPRVNFVGEVSQHDLARFISASDVCVNPMMPEKLDEYGNINAQKTYEYLACETPAIESYAPKHSLPEWANKYLKLVPAGDPKALAAAMGELIQSKGINKEKLENGRAFVMKEFSWEAVTHRTLALIQKAMIARHQTTLHETD